MILLVDNYDSFVHNLARYLRRLGQETHVVRNDAVNVAEVRTRKPQALVLSPGPATPVEAGCSLDLVRALWKEIPLLGVCLGHQTLAAALGGRIVRASEPVHGRTSAIQHDGQGVFRGLPCPFVACRYHSLVVERETLPSHFQITALTAQGEIMGIQHQQALVVGVQFHPESILTDQGYRLLGNFLEMAGIEHASLPEMKTEQVPPAVKRPSLPSVPITF